MEEWLIFCIFTDNLFMNKSYQIMSKALEMGKLLRNWLERGKIIEITLNVLFYLVLWFIWFSQILSLNDFDIWHKKPLLSHLAKEFGINNLKAMSVKFPFSPKPEVPIM